AWNTGQTGLPFWNSYTLKNVLNRIFNTPLLGFHNFLLEPDIAEWLVASFSYFYWGNIPGWGIVPIESMPAKGLWFISCGYRSMYDQGESRYGWFESLCLAMGWVFYFDTLG